MHKTRRLIDVNGASSQMFLILSSLITLGSESQIYVFKQCQSNTQISGGWGGGVGEGGSIRRSQNLETVVFFSGKKLHKALRSVQFLASFFSFHFEILCYPVCGEKIIRPLASQNSVKLGEKSTSNF